MVGRNHLGNPGYKDAKAKGLQLKLLRLALAETRRDGKLDGADRKLLDAYHRALDKASEVSEGRRAAPGCQYIAGEPNDDDDCKCRVPVHPRSAYCPEHHKICVSGQKPIAAVLL